MCCNNSGKIDHYLEIAGQNDLKDKEVTYWGGVMMFNTTFNNISVIWWRSVLRNGRKPQTCHKSLTNFIT
jgi:hypothetical protein